MKKSMMCFVAGIVALLFFNCEGPAGPAGEQGIQGEQGIPGQDGQQGIPGQDGANGQDGQDGQPGVDGQDGNANVFTKIFNGDEITWADEVYYGSNYKVATLNFDKITQEVVDTGAVLVYIRLISGDSWTALPYSYYEWGTTHMYRFGVNLGNVKLWRSKSDNTIPAFPTVPFKVVVIEGRLASTMRDHQVNLYNHDEVMLAIEKYHVNIK